MTGIRVGFAKDVTKPFGFHGGNIWLERQKVGADTRLGHQVLQKPIAPRAERPARHITSDDGHVHRYAYPL